MTNTAGFPIAAALLVGALLAGCGGSSGVTANATVAINPAKQYQRIAGFGVSEGFGQAKTLAVHGTINGVDFQAVLEPDGNSGHWMRADDTLQHAAGISVGDTAALGIEVTKDWPEPSVPQDLATALAAAPAEDPEPVDRDHPHGALGMGALGQRHEEP